MIHPMFVDLLVIFTTATCISTEAIVITSDIIRRIDRYVDDSAEMRQQAYLADRTRRKIKENYKFEECDDPESLDYKGVPNKRGRIKIGSLVYDDRYNMNQYYVLCNRCHEVHIQYNWSHTKIWNLYLDQIGQLATICEVCHEPLSMDSMDSPPAHTRLANRNMRLPVLSELENLRIND